MKAINTSLLTLFSALLILSCEKPVIDDNGDNTENKKTDVTDKDGSGDDNGGWNGDSSGDYDTTEWQSGDTLNVAKFINAELTDAVWVKGYIVGCGNGAKAIKYDFERPYEYDTSILLADNPRTTDLNHVVSIQLPSNSRMRSKLNLVDNASNAGRIVAVYGYKTTYLRLPGIKSPGAWELK